MGTENLRIGGHSGARRSRAALVTIAALVPLVPIIVGITLSSAGGAGHAAINPFTPVSSSARGSSPPSSTGTLVALLEGATILRASPGGRPLARLSTRTEFGSPTAMWVVARSSGWLGVITPLAGNGQIGWIPAASSSLSRVAWELRVSLSARRLTVLDSGKVLERYTVAIGQAGAPTPTGRFAVTDRLFTNDPSGPYGCCILALSAHSPHAIQGWSGGTRIAIHSTPETASIGEPASHGCVRVTLAEGRWLLAHIPLGTPTVITS